MIVHILPDSVFIRDLIQKIQRYSDNPLNNQYCVFTPKPWKHLSEENPQIISAPLYSKSINEVINNLSSTDTLVFHNFRREVYTWFISHPKKCKVCWVFWGAELFNMPMIKLERPLFLPKTLKASFLKKVDQYGLQKIPFLRVLENFYIKNIKAPKIKAIAQKAFERVDFFYHFNAYDFQVLQKNFNVPTKLEHFVYPTLFTPGDNLSLEVSPNKINILVGNSADPNSNHLDVFDMLPKDEAISYWVPLSYTNYPKYREKVIKVGREKFGDAFKPILNFLPSDEYFAFLQKMDFAVFGSIRSKALGNILALLAYGKGVYLHPGTNTYNNLTDQGIKVFDLQDLSLERFKENKKQLPLTHNQQNVLALYGEEHIGKIYKKLF